MSKLHLDAISSNQDAKMYVSINSGTFISSALTWSESDRQLKAKTYLKIKEFCLKSIKNSNFASIFTF